jgi:hypothetical protein
LPFIHNLSYLLLCINNHTLKNPDTLKPIRRAVARVELLEILQKNTFLDTASVNFAPTHTLTAFTRSTVLISLGIQLQKVIE